MLPHAYMGKYCKEFIQLLNAKMCTYIKNHLYYVFKPLLAYENKLRKYNEKCIRSRLSC